MTKRLEDFEKTYKHPVEKARRYVLDANYRKRIDDESPYLGKELREVAQQDGIVGEDMHARNRRLAGVKEPEPPKRYDATEHAIREEHPKAQVTEIWRTQRVRLENGDYVSLPQYRKSHPIEANKLDIAAYSYGLTQRKPEPLPVPEQPKEPSTFALSDDLADRYNVQRGTVVTVDEFHKLIEQFAIKQTAEQSSQATSEQPTT